jgi:hypothetical protein
MGWPTAREGHGHGACVVVSAEESSVQGEGRQVSLIQRGSARDAHLLTHMKVAYWRAECAKRCMLGSGEGRGKRAESSVPRLLPILL